ncbi:unnamed protein product, partial [marine sediment metagenome]
NNELSAYCVRSVGHLIITKKGNNMEKNLTNWIKKQTPTIYDIKRALPEDSHFFDKKTMKFFNQTLKSFSVKKQGFNEWRISASAPFGNVTVRTFSFTGFNMGKLN